MKFKISLYCFITGIIMASSLPVFAAWEIGGKAGYNSNVNRTVDGEEGDTSLGAHIQYAREVSGETRFDWTFGASLEGNSFLKNSDLSNGVIHLAPGVVYFPYLSWSIELSPFVQGKVMSDNDQSALAFGGKVNLKQPFTKYFYMGEYYAYTASRAKEDVYSFSEHTLGISLGVNWTTSFFTELGYEYAHGDSFQTLKSSSTVPSGWGGRQHAYSSSFKTEVYKDIVDRHSVGVTIGAELSSSVSAVLSYTYTTSKGDLGSSDNHGGGLGIGYRF
jgi:hypothetical protein